MLQWEPAMETGVGVIDRQHKALVGQVNELMAAMKSGKGREAVSDLLSFLGKYAVEHFGSEEALMVRHGYPDYEAHKTLHERFKEDFGALSRECQEGTRRLSLTIDVQRRVTDWLRDHILRVDAKFGTFLRDRGVA